MTRPDYVGHCVHNNWRDKQSQTNSVNYGRRVNHTRVPRYTYLKVLYTFKFHYRYTIHIYLHIITIHNLLYIIYIIYHRATRTAHNII